MQRSRPVVPKSSTKDGHRSSGLEKETRRDRGCFPDHPLTIAGSVESVSICPSGASGMRSGA